MPRLRHNVIETLAQIESEAKPRFSAGIVLWDDKVIEAADIVKYMKGWARDRVRSYCAQRGWEVRVVWEMVRNPP